MSHTSPDDFTEKNKRQRKNDDDKYNKETSQLQDGNESVHNSEISDTLYDVSIINTTKE